jgi:lipopolysaccharide export system protein LptC
MTDAATHQRPTNTPERSRLGRAWLLAGLGLAAAVIALMVIDRTERTDLLEPFPVLAERDADMFIEGADISQFGEDGTLQYQLLAEHIRHFELDAVTALSAPVMRLYDDGAAPWVARARRGSVQRTPPPRAEEVIYLREDVSLEQIGPDGGRMHLATAAIDLYPGRQYAETDQDVMIETHIGRTTATGLEGDFQRGTLNLFSSDEAPVHTVLQPEHFK